MHFARSWPPSLAPTFLCNQHRHEMWWLRVLFKTWKKKNKAKTKQKQANKWGEKKKKQAGIPPLLLKPVNVDSKRSCLGRARGCWCIQVSKWCHVVEFLRVSFFATFLQNTGNCRHIHNRFYMKKIIHYTKSGTAKWEMSALQSLKQPECSPFCITTVSQSRMIQSTTFFLAGPLSRSVHQMHWIRNQTYCLEKWALIKGEVQNGWNKQYNQMAKPTESCIPTSTQGSGWCQENLLNQILCKQPLNLYTSFSGCLTKDGQSLWLPFCLVAIPNNIRYCTESLIFGKPGSIVVSLVLTLLRENM